ncbi:hypothetical protein ACFWMU_25770 [Streptomyces sp. NPDC058357]|uniref:hypothetical protein n=1 Tax=unclassified Streptomyces TaxID=2593676 RepID=UPI003661A98D
MFVILGAARQVVLMGGIGRDAVGLTARFMTIAKTRYVFVIPPGARGLPRLPGLVIRPSIQSETSCHWIVPMVSTVGLLQVESKFRGFGLPANEMLIS